MEKSIHKMDKSKYIETIIIGCGPSGLQLGYFLNKIKKEYIILEKSDIAGSFFSKFPHSQELISINKVHTGETNKEFNLRHDWNSLLNNHAIEMKKYTKEYYPSRNNLVQYLNDFSKLHNINIQYNTQVINISKNITDYDKEMFYVTCHNKGKKEIFICDKLIIATGLSKRNIPNINNIDLYTKHYGDYPTDYFLNKKNLEKYNNKKILLLGHGNSSFELAQLLTPHCSNIVILGRDTPPRPAFCSHYVGDLRSKYLGFYDTFLLKSLNAYNYNSFYTYKDNPIIHKTLDDKYYITTSKNTCRTINFDEIINCTGWLFDDSIFDDSSKPEVDNDKKYPVINGLYESVNIDNLFFIGALMHSFDNKKGSGGFIHGFRYLIDNFVKINYTNFAPKLFNGIESLSLHFSKRINVSSALYQMHGQLCDFFYKIDDKYIYYEEVPLSYICSKQNSKIYIPHGYIFILTLEYGTKIECDLRKIGTRTTDIGTESSSILLHPILRIYNNKQTLLSDYDVFHPSYANLLNISSIEEIIHFDEELLTDFTNNIKYNNRFYKIVKGYS